MPRSSGVRCLRACARALLVAAIFLAGAVEVRADYEGWSDTGYSYRTKRDCCEAAIRLAQEDSVRNCRNAGGFPDLSFGRNAARGKCDVQMQSDGRGGRVYRCLGTAAVDCH
jgi:hypothetical protein